MLQAEFALIYGHTARLALGLLVHLIGWICAGVAGLIAYQALGVPIEFDDALAIEALLSAAAALAFLVPVNAGVQEAGYAGLGAVFGVPPGAIAGGFTRPAGSGHRRRRADSAAVAIFGNAATAAEQGLVPASSVGMFGLSRHEHQAMRRDPFVTAG